MTDRNNNKKIHGYPIKLKHNINHLKLGSFTVPFTGHFSYIAWNIAHIYVDINSCNEPALDLEPNPPGSCCLQIYLTVKLHK